MEKTQKKHWRRRLYEIIETNYNRSIPGRIYDIFMLAVILCSLAPLAFKVQTDFLRGMENICVNIFGIDYLLRWVTEDYRSEKHKGFVAFLLYPFTGMAILDLLSMMPSVTVISNGLPLLRVMRMLRAVRVVRLFKTFRYSDTLRMISRVLQKQKDSLAAVGLLAVGYILLTALIIFNIEPETFNTFFDAVYWATISLTTVGYGDIFAVSTAGRIITMISALFGIAIVALPAGIITAGYMDELHSSRAHHPKNAKKEAPASENSSAEKLPAEEKKAEE